MICIVISFRHYIPWSSVTSSTGGISQANKPLSIKKLPLHPPKVKNHTNMRIRTNHPLFISARQPHNLFFCFICPSNLPHFLFYSCLIHYWVYFQHATINWCFQSKVHGVIYLLWGHVGYNLGSKEHLSQHQFYAWTMHQLTQNLKVSNSK